MTDTKKLRELAIAICKTDFESEDFNDTLLIDHVAPNGGTTHIAFETVKPLRDFIAACNPQDIIKVLDMVDRYEQLLRNNKEFFDKIQCSMGTIICERWATDAAIKEFEICEALEGNK